jgi:acetophenone carboxylase
MERAMESTRRITEYIDLDLVAERWRCNRCGADLGDARDTYKKGCLIAARDPAEVHQPLVAGTAYSFAPDRDWCQIVVLVEVEYLPPGHPLTHDIELDIDAMKARHTAPAGEAAE